MITLQFCGGEECGSGKKQELWGNTQKANMPQEIE